MLDQAEFKIMLFQVKMVIANEIIVLKQFNFVKRMTVKCFDAITPKLLIHWKQVILTF